MRGALMLGTILLLSALPHTLAAAPLFTVQIVDVHGERVDGKVVVTVRLAGTTLDLFALGAPVEGEVDVTTPTPCWSDFRGACAAVITTRTRSFLATPIGSAWEASVGPFEYPAAPAGFSCDRLDVAARAGSGPASAEDQRVLDVCA